jgi:hypothetical protein
MIAALLLALLLQGPKAAPPPPKPGAIRGRVVAADSGKPLLRASVTVLSASDGRTSRLVASTNAQGRFEIKDVPAGSYYVSVAKAGYLPMRFGQRRQSEPALAVEVGESMTVDDVDVTLPRTGVIGGHISDELGEPYPGVQVMALAMRYSGGQRIASPAGSSTTNDLGQYRIPGLGPGAYTVVAISTETWRNDKLETLGYATTYYPGGSAALAQPVMLAASQQRLDLDFGLRPSRAVRVSGRVITDTGAPADVGGVNFSYKFGDGVLGAGFRSGRVAADGSFEVKDVTEGVYSLYTTSALDQTVTVADADVTGLTLVTTMGSSVSGTIVTDDDTPPPFRTAGVRVLLEAPVGRVIPTVRLVGPELDWSFKTTGLAGPYLFRLLGLPDGWRLASVKLGERDITDAPWDVPGGARDFGGLKLVVTRNSASIAGAVVDRDGRPAPSATIVAFADDDTLWMPGTRFTRALRPGRDGQFVIKGLPPGTYRVIARDAIEEGQWEDRAFLEEARDQAVRVVLGDGAAERIALTLPRQK